MLMWVWEQCQQQLTFTHSLYPATLFKNQNPNCREQYNSTGATPTYPHPVALHHRRHLLQRPAHTKLALAQL